MLKIDAMLRAGYAQVDISPGPDCGLIGYEFRQQHLPPGNMGIHDPLYARVLTLENADGRAVIVSLDLCILSVANARRLRAVIAKIAKTTSDRVLLSCTHTHSGPYPRWPGDARVAEPTGTAAADFRYGRFLVGQLRVAVAHAAGLMHPVSVSSQQAPFGFAYNRRVATRHGIKHCWNPQEQEELHPLPAADPACTAIVLTQQNGPRRFILWSASAHPVVLGKTSRVISADWPGAACALIDAGTPHTHSLFLLGPCGELHPWIATQESPANIAPVARTAASFVQLLAQAARETSDSLAIATKMIKVGRDNLDLAAWRIGSAQLLAAPVELFNSLGATLRQSAGDPLIIATNTNGWTGYWPDATAFDQGAYEVDAARLMGRKPGDGDRLIRSLLALARTTNRGDA